MFFSKVARILAIVAFVLGLLERALINPIRPSRHTTLWNSGNPPDFAPESALPLKAEFASKKCRRGTNPACRVPAPRS
jgi:hypothetical protein